MSGLSTVDACENCGRTIGRLEKACVWQDHVVCLACFDVLAAEPIATPAVPVQADTRAVCPSCGGASTAMCSAVHAAGTSTGSYGGVVWGGGIQAVDVGTTAQQSLLAHQCAPPAVPQNATAYVAILGVICGAIALVFAVSTDYGRNGGPMVYAVAAGIVAVACFVSLPAWGRGYKADVARWQKLRMMWEKRWVCMRCGKQFQV